MAVTPTFHSVPNPPWSISTSPASQPSPRVRFGRLGVRSSAGGSLRQAAAAVAAVRGGSITTPSASPTSPSASPRTKQRGGGFVASSPGPPEEETVLTPRTKPGVFRGVPAEFATLCDFVTSAGFEDMRTPEGAAMRTPEWAAMVTDTVAAINEEACLHLKICSKCRAFSTFARAHALKKNPPMTELTFATLCREGMQRQDGVIMAVMRAKQEENLQSIAESLAMDLDQLYAFPGITDLRLNANPSSIAACMEERDRIVAQADMRKEIMPVLKEVDDARAMMQEWCNFFEAHFGGQRRVPHENGSLLTGADVHDFATNEFTVRWARAVVQIAAWESRWSNDGRGVSLREVFSIFGNPTWEGGDMIPLSEAVLLTESFTDWKWMLDNHPLMTEDVDAVRPMRVVVRIRPELEHEAGDAITASVLEDGATVRFRGSSGGDQLLSFDTVLDCVSQASLFSRSGVKALVHRACEGHTATVFTFGQTGAGKTYSLLGPLEYMWQLADDTAAHDSNLPSSCCKFVDGARWAKVCEQGLVPRAVQFAFAVLKSGVKDGGASCTVQASCFEIYNECIFDLLQTSSVPSTAPKLDVHQRPAPERGFHVQGLKQVECSTPEALLQVLRQGVAARRVAGHAMSRESSRGHFVFTIELPPVGEKPGSGGRLIFADLAGSERLKGTQVVQHLAMSHHNKSLMMLSSCVAALSSYPSSGSGAGGSATASVPASLSVGFRNSKLTKVLMESLRGTGYTLVLAAISPAERHAEETTSTLAFANRCSNILRPAPDELSLTSGAVDQRRPRALPKRQPQRASSCCAKFRHRFIEGNTCGRGPWH